MPAPSRTGRGGGAADAGSAGGKPRSSSAGRAVSRERAGARVGCRCHTHITPPPLCVSHRVPLHEYIMRSTATLFGAWWCALSSLACAFWGAGPAGAAAGAGARRQGAPAGSLLGGQGQGLRPPQAGGRRPGKHVGKCTSGVLCSFLVCALLLALPRVLTTLGATLDRRWPPVWAGGGAGTAERPPQGSGRGAWTLWPGTGRAGSLCRQQCNTPWTGGRCSRSRGGGGSVTTHLTRRWGYDLCTPTGSKAGQHTGHGLARDVPSLEGGLTTRFM